MPAEIFHITSAGSVDDGKSTILARLLLDTGSVFEDQLGGLDAKKVDATTIADLLDGLESEREQGITIDVAHRFFDSHTRRYHIADSPGHEQYTRNMATAASHANALLLVVDARVGIKPQTRTHLGIAKKLGIKRFVVAVNKMDLVDYKKRVFTDLSQNLQHLLQSDDESSPEFSIIPVSGLVGDNVVRPTKRMSWWKGVTLLEALEQFTLAGSTDGDAVFAVQLVQRKPGGGRRYLGSLLQGQVSTGSELTSPRYRGRQFRVTELYDRGQFAEAAYGPSEISLEIDAEIDLERGDVLTRDANTIEHTDQFEADLVWLDEQQGFPGRTYTLRIGHQSTKATLTRLFDIDQSGQKGGQRDHLDTNAILRCNIETHDKVSLATFQALPDMGRLILVEPASGNTVAAGVVNHTLRRADNLVQHDFSVELEERAALTGYAGAVAWFTGLSGSGKSTLANEVSLALTQRGIPHTVLDGDGLRLGLNRDLGFTEADRVENIRRAAEVAKLMADAGLIVLVSLISPYRTDREHARDIIGAERFIEVFVDTPLKVCEERDPKGLYKKARAGLIPNFTGIDAPYEAPDNPAIRIVATKSPGASASLVLPLVVHRHAP